MQMVPARYRDLSYCSEGSLFPFKKQFLNVKSVDFMGQPGTAVVEANLKETLVFLGSPREICLLLQY